MEHGFACMEDEVALKLLSLLCCSPGTIGNKPIVLFDPAPWVDREPEMTRRFRT